MTTTVQVRVDKKIKEESRRVFKSMGMDLSTGINLFLVQVVREKGLPFRPTTNPAALRARWDAEVEMALKTGKIFKSGKDALKDLRIC